MSMVKHRAIVPTNEYFPVPSYVKSSPFYEGQRLQLCACEGKDLQIIISLDHDPVNNIISILTIVLVDRKSTLEISQAFDE